MEKSQRPYIVEDEALNHLIMLSLKLFYLTKAECILISWTPETYTKILKAISWWQVHFKQGGLIRKRKYKCINKDGTGTGMGSSSGKGDGEEGLWEEIKGQLKLKDVWMVEWKPSSVETFQNIHIWRQSKWNH